MRNLWIVLAALGISGCTSVDATSDGDGRYTLVIPTDVIETQSMIQRDTLIAAYDLCPHGFSRRVEDDLSPGGDILWDIECFQVPPHG